MQLFDETIQSILKRIQECPDIIILVCLILIGWFIRVIIAVNTGGLVHPDEIYQSLEMAHKLKYGYGLIPWEFRIPGVIYEDNLPGVWMYSPGALRSLAFPLIIYFIFEFCELIGIPYGINGTLGIVRIFSATYSTLLIPIVFYLSKELYPPQKKPCLFSLFAAFLTTVWYVFPFFGIRTLTNSFAAIPIFLGIISIF